jgi:hypothetical protein
MKRFWLLIALLTGFVFAWWFGAALQANAQPPPDPPASWVPTNQMTIAWDAVAPPEPDDIISYYVYVAYASTGEQLGSIDTPHGKALQEVAVLQATVSFTAEGRYYLGVAAKRVVTDGTVIVSDVNWSNVNGTTTPNPFGAVYYAPANQPENLRPL